MQIYIYIFKVPGPPMTVDFTSMDYLVAGIGAAMMAHSAIFGRSLGEKPRSERRLARKYVVTAIRGALISALILFVWYRSGRPFAELGLDWPITLPGLAGFGFDALLLCFLGYKLLQRRSAEQASAARQRMDSLHIMPQTHAEFMLFLAMVLLASPFEELMFRGFLMWFFGVFAGLWGAVLLTSLLFGIGHAYQGPSRILRTGLLGLAFGTAYALTHSLWWLMVAHIALNAYGALLAWQLTRQSPAPAE